MMKGHKGKKHKKHLFYIILIVIVFGLSIIDAQASTVVHTQNNSIHHVIAEEMLSTQNPAFSLGSLFSGISSAISGLGSAFSSGLSGLISGGSNILSNIGGSVSSMGSLTSGLFGNGSVSTAIHYASAALPVLRSIGGDSSFVQYADIILPTLDAFATHYTQQPVDAASASDLPQTTSDEGAQSSMDLGSIVRTASKVFELLK
jgi:hypothetical protein